MEVTDSVAPLIQVLLVGGGFAVLEAVLGLRFLFGERAQITLVSPKSHLTHRPAATFEAFAEDFSPHEERPSTPRTYDLRAICQDLDVAYRRDRLEAIASKNRCVNLASFAHLHHDDRLHYDELILALGARATVAVPGALTFRDQRDVPRFRRLLADLRAGDIGHLVFAVPSGCTWPLPLYELALMTAAHARRHRVRMDISLVTPEAAPLERFGSEASELVAGVLADRGVRFRGATIPASVAADGALALHFHGDIKADRVVATPQLRGPRITGLPGDWWGFISTDPHGRVETLPHVYATGDMTVFPVKQDGLAVQQADLIAHHIAAAHGLADNEPLSAERIVCVRLLGGTESLFLHVAMDDRGRPQHSSLHFEDDALSEQAGAATVLGRHLTSYMRDLELLAAAS